MITFSVDYFADTKQRSGGQVFDSLTIKKEMSRFYEKQIDEKNDYHTILYLHSMWCARTEFKTAGN